MLVFVQGCDSRGITYRSTSCQSHASGVPATRLTPRAHTSRVCLQSLLFSFPRTTRQHTCNYPADFIQYCISTISIAGTRCWSSHSTMSAAAAAAQQSYSPIRTRNMLIEWTCSFSMYVKLQHAVVLPRYRSPHHFDLCSTALVPCQREPGLHTASKLQEPASVDRIDGGWNSALMEHHMLRCGRICELQRSLRMN